MATEQEILLRVDVQRVQVVAGVVNLIDQTVVHRVTEAVEINAGTGAVADRRVQNRVVVAADHDPRFSRGLGVAAVFDLPGRIQRV